MQSRTSWDYMHMMNESMANKLVYMAYFLAVSNGLNSIQVVAFLWMAFLMQLL